MKTHRQGLSIPVSRNSPAKVLRSQPHIIQAFLEMATLFFTGAEMGDRDVPVGTQDFLQQTRALLRTSAPVHVLHERPHIVTVIGSPQTRNLDRINRMYRIGFHEDLASKLFNLFNNVPKVLFDRKAACL